MYEVISSFEKETLQKFGRSFDIALILSEISRELQRQVTGLKIKK
jgi:hypothetical protein